MRFPVFPSRPTAIFTYLPSTTSSCKLNHDMHACLARNYPEALSHCGNRHDHTLVAQLPVINIADIRSVFVETLASERFHKNTVDGAP